MKISFGYKIQFAVLLILLVTLSSYIGLASRTLLNEKIASLLETTAADAEVIASRISRKLSAQQFWVEGILSNDNSSQRKNLFEANTNLLSVIKKTNGNTERVFDRSPDISSILPPFSAPKGMSFVPSSREKSFWQIKVFDDGSTLYSLWSQDIFQDEQKNYGDGSVFLISSNSKDIMTLTSDTESSSVLKTNLQNQTFSQSLSSKRLDVKNNKFIIATAPVEYFPLIAVASFPESLALEPVRELQIRSIYFALFVIGITGLLSFWIGRALTAKLYILTKETKEIAKGNLDASVGVKSNDEIGELSNSIVSMAKDLKHYIQEVAEKSRMETELKTAKTVQDMLFPEKDWSNEQFEIHGYYESASECGGDLWFYWNVGPYLFFIIADATGHGAPAALITSAARSTIGVVQYLGEESISKIAELLHQSVMAASKGTILMTGWMGRLDLNSGDIQYVNCSHEPPLIIKEDGSFDVISGVNNPRIGDRMAPQQAFNTGQIKLAPGERLCLYTDGLSDMETSTGHRYSDRKFLSLLGSSFSKGHNIPEGMSSIIQFLKDFSEHRPLEDDITMVIVGHRA